MGGGQHWAESGVSVTHRNTTKNKKCEETKHTLKFIFWFLCFSSVNEISAAKQDSWQNQTLQKKKHAIYKYSLISQMWGYAAQRWQPEGNYE